MSITERDLIERGLIESAAESSLNIDMRDAGVVVRESISGTARSNKSQIRNPRYLLHHVPTSRKRYRLNP